ncbi:hypothetical protein HDU67_001392, partial [Dinochytrium kinnereticum]
MQQQLQYQPFHITTLSARKLASQHNSRMHDYRRAVLVQNLIDRIHADRAAAAASSSSYCLPPFSPSPSPSRSSTASTSATSPGMPAFSRLSPANRLKKQREEALKRAAATAAPAIAKENDGLESMEAVPISSFITSSASTTTTTTTTDGAALCRTKVSPAIPRRTSSSNLSRSI